jgi:hypothetical protein
MTITNEQKIAIIASAETMRFFFAKQEEKIVALIADIADDTGIDATIVGEFLQAEKDARSEAHRARIAKQLARAEQKASLPISGGYDALQHATREGSRFLVTVAQNNTDVDASMLGALETFAKENDAELIICKTFYNLNGFQNPDHDAVGVYFDPKLTPYLQHDPCYLGSSRLYLAADANVIPTAKNPLAGFEGLTRAGVSIIVPAVKVALKCTASLKGADGKDLYSTGAVTKRHYVKRKAGQVADSEHNIAALFVEVFEDGSYSARHLEQMANTSGFYDLHTAYTASEAIPVPDSVACLQFGDIHAEKMTFDNRVQALAMLRKFKPANVMLHDVLDFSSRNHHNIKDAFFIARNDAGQESVVNDLNAVSGFIIEVLESYAAEYNARVRIIESNHDLALERWIKEADFKKDALNAGVYLPLATAMMREAYKGRELNLLQHAMTLPRGELVDAAGNENIPITDSAFWQLVNFHGTDESVTIAGVEHGVHGHSGLNGSRGSPAQFRTLGVPMNTGHTHTPSIQGAVYTAGVAASLEMGYNVGPSSWRIAHVVTYVNGQRQVIFS